MTTLIFLWLSLILYSFYFAGHLFDILANVPNWKSGELEAVGRYRAFYGKSTPKNYFLPLVLGTPVVSLIALYLVWPLGNPITLYLGIAVLMTLAVLVMTVKIFVPINKYIFGSQEYDPVQLKKMVNRWISLDYLRLFLIGLGMIAAILGLDAFLG